MIKKSITPKDVVDLLNKMLCLDSKGTQRFIQNRVEVNMKVANHPTIQVKNYIGDPFPTLGPIGFLNGLFGTTADGWGVIAYEGRGTAEIWKTDKFRILGKKDEAARARKNKEKAK